MRTYRITVTATTKDAQKVMDGILRCKFNENSDNEEALRADLQRRYPNASIEIEAI